MEVNGIDIAVERKKIKNLHLAVYPPDARVHVSSPDYLDDNDVRSFVISKWDWVEEKRRGTGAIICTCPQPNLLRENLLQLPVWYI